VTGGIKAEDSGEEASLTGKSREQRDVLQKAGKKRGSRGWKSKKG